MHEPFAETCLVTKVEVGDHATLNAVDDTARMGDDPKTSVTDKYCRLHDVKNVYLADAAPFVCGGTQNTTWSILAMAWRTMDFLKEQMRAGDL